MTLSRATLAGASATAAAAAVAEVEGLQHGGTAEQCAAERVARLVAVRLRRRVGPAGPVVLAVGQRVAGRKLAGAAASRLEGEAAGQRRVLLVEAGGLREEWGERVIGRRCGRDARHEKRGE
jgi:hypothetical protein